MVIVAGEKDQTPLIVVSVFDFGFDEGTGGQRIAGAGEFVGW